MTKRAVDMTPEEHEKHLAWCRAYRQTPERKAYAKRYFQENKEKLRGQERTRYWENRPENKRKMAYKNLKNKFGLTREQYDSMLLAQSGRCYICCDAPTRSKNFHVDHDHKTGAVRKLLCNNCNAVLGWSKENIGRLQNVIAYLLEHGVTDQ